MKVKCLLRDNCISKVKKEKRECFWIFFYIKKKICRKKHPIVCKRNHISAMSYDYNAILQNIQENRSKAYRNCCGSSCYPFNDSNGNPTAISNVDIGPLNVAVEEYATLSSHCPLPPILWLQYACDAGVLMEQLLLDK